MYGNVTWDVKWGGRDAIKYQQCALKVLGNNEEKVCSDKPQNRGDQGVNDQLILYEKQV